MFLIGWRRCSHLNAALCARDGKMKIEQVNNQDVGALVELIWSVASSNSLPSLSEEGRKSFISSIHPDVETALDSTRSQKSGVGTRLLRHLLSKSSAREGRLKSSVNAVGFYESQGFAVTDTEQNVKGIRYVPMSWLRT